MEVSNLRYFATKVTGCVLLLFTCGAQAARPETLIKVQAPHVAFYYDRFLIEADGGVHVSMSDGTTITGQSFSMDLKLNRFVVAGTVHVSSSAGSQDGAGLADFLDFNRVYFVPIVPQDDQRNVSNRATPDRWTFVEGDYAHPAKGRQMPGDTFFLPDLTSEKPYLIGTSAVIGARSFVRFGGNKVDVADGLGAYVPAPSFYVNFSPDQHLAQNTLTGANFDATYPFAGGSHAISAAHLRYDTINKLYFAYEQHVSGPKSYAVFSVNPLTRPSKFFNLLLSDQPNDHFQIRSFTQLHTFQHGFSQPLEAQQSTLVQATQSLRQSYLQASYQFINYNLLAPTPSNEYGGHGIVPLHPSNFQASVIGFEHPLGRLPLRFRLRYGIGFQHDPSGLQSLVGPAYTTIWQHDIGLTLLTPQVTLGNAQGMRSNLYFLNGLLDKDRQWNSSGHYIDIADTTFSLSRFFTPHVSAYAQYDVRNTSDVYGSLQSAAYPGFTPVIGGVSYPSYSAFHGLSTLRTLSLSATYINADDFSFSMLVRKHTDFPLPIPFFFPFPPTNVLGQQETANFLGQPPYDVSGDLRVRINPHMTIDLQRSYFFNYSNLRWSPQFVIQVSQ